jgi:hypothetical protein
MFGFDWQTVTVTIVAAMAAAVIVRRLVALAPGAGARRGQPPCASCELSEGSKLRTPRT